MVRERASETRKVPTDSTFLPIAVARPVVCNCSVIAGPPRIRTGRKHHGCSSNDCSLRKMNPYEPPNRLSNSTPEANPIETHDGFIASGRPCPFCGSKNTRKDTLSRSSPSIISVICFGWFFLLIRAALSKERDQCGDCQEINTYKSTGSKLAILSLVVLAIISVLVAMEPK